MDEKPATSQAKASSVSSRKRKQTELRKAEAVATKSRDHNMRKLFEKQSELEEFRRTTEERVRNLEKQLRLAQKHIDEDCSARLALEKAAGEVFAQHDQVHKETRGQLHSTKEEFVEHREAHRETKQQLNIAQTHLENLASAYHTLRVDFEHLKARIEGLESRPPVTGGLSEAQLALLARVPSRTDLENMGFWVTDSIEVLKKDLTVSDQKMTASLEKRLTTQEKSAQMVESKLRKVFMKADLWRFSRAVDEAIRDAVKKTVRTVGQAMEVKIDGKAMDLVPSGDFYGMQMDEDRDAEVFAKREPAGT